MTRVGFAGLGRMGALIASNLAGAGFQLALWNRSTAKAEQLAGATDAVVRATPRELAESPDGRPFDITEYQATAEATTATVEEFNRLLASLNDFLASPDWEARQSQLDAATAQARSSLEELIDRGFRRGLVLIGVLVVGGLAAAVVYRAVATRLIAPRRGSAS